MNDYERTNARAWDPDYKERSQQEPVSSGWKVVEPERRRDPPRNLVDLSPRTWHVGGSPKRTSQRKGQPTRLVQRSDNDAEAEWRARQEPTDHVRIPDDLILKDKSDTSGAHHEILAKQHGAFIYSQHVRGSGGSRTFGIWGEKNAVAATKRAVADWVDEHGFGTRSTRSASFAKIVSLTPKRRERAEARWEREVRRQIYRQHPPYNMGFGAVGSFLWPIEEYRPEEILGANHEALDPIRMDCSCYVVFHKERNAFRVMGKPSEVKIGLQRIRQTCFQMAAKQCNPVRMYVLHRPEPEKVPLFVYLAEYEPPVIMSPEPHKDAEDTKTRKSPRVGEYEPSDETTKRARKQTRVESERLRTATLRAISKLHYYRGHIQMRIRLGTFLVDQYMDPKHGLYDLDEYESMIQDSQFIGEVTQELGDKATEQILLSVLQEATHLLTPQEATIEELTDVKPVYAASFTFEDPVGNYRLTVEWHEASDESNGAVNFETISKKWTRLDRDSGAPSPLLDVSLCDLNTRSAWQFDILASPQVVEETRLSQQLLDFSRNLKIDPKAALKPEQIDLFVRFNPYANLASVQQRISYQYTIANSDFTLELSRFQDRTYPSRAKSALTSSSAAAGTVFEPRWSLNVFRKAWDAMLANNERLPIGEQADWRHDVATWFPYDVGPGSPEVDEENASQGWEQLLVKLGRVEGIVKEAKAKTDEGEEDLVGGMAVG